MEWKNAGLLFFSPKFSLSHWPSQPETLSHALILSVGYPVFTLVSTEGQSTFFTLFQTRWPASPSSRGNYVFDRSSTWGQEMMQRHLLCSIDTASTIDITIRSITYNKVPTGKHKCPVSLPVIATLSPSCLRDWDLNLIALIPLDSVHFLWRLRLMQTPMQWLILALFSTKTISKCVATFSLWNLCICGTWAFSE